MQGRAEIGDARPGGGSVLLRHVAAAAARRAAVAAPEPAAVPVPVATARTPERIITGAIGRAAGRMHDLRLFFDRVGFGRATLAELAELIPEKALISVVEGPGEALGVVAICPGLLAAVIEMQATGRISARAPLARRPTRADGLICADFINACLAELGEELATLPGCGEIGGYRYASFLDEPRPLELMLDDGGFHLLQVRLRAGDTGQRDGRILIALPAAAGKVGRPAIATIGDGPGSTAEERPARVTLAETVRGVPIDLVGVLCRRMISLGELRALAPGDTIPLSPDVLGAATLETTAGQVLFCGKLGELAGRHALRLTQKAQGAAAPGRTGHGATGAAEDGASLHEPPIADLDTADAFRRTDPAGLPQPFIGQGSAESGETAASHGKVA